MEHLSTTIRLLLWVALILFLVLVAGAIYFVRKPAATFPKYSIVQGDPAFEYGERIFISDCSVCHVTKKRLHNHLEGVVDRVGEDYLKLYITKQDSLVQSGDTYALQLKEVWGNMGNSHNFNYTANELAALIEYLR
ncbi:MAG: c-type cytochrome [Chitinophagaceae bacterium]|nr:c-type cytochrome [Chitinophagaceae bacterium]